MEQTTQTVTKNKGRPKKNNKNKHIVAAHITDSLFKEVNVFADKRQISLSHMVRIGLELLMAKYKDEPSIGLI